MHEWKGFIMNEFGFLLKELRTERRMSQQVLGELCGLTQSIIAQYEAGKKVPSFNTLENLAEVLGVEQEKLREKLV